MFDHNITFYGKHADYLRKLAPSKIAGESLIQRQTLFGSNIDVITVAPLIGFMFDRKSNQEHSDDITKNNIMLEQVLKVRAQLTLSFRLLMLLANDGNPSEEERIDRAFRYEGNPEKLKPLENIFFQYMRGGIEILYERLVRDANSTEDDIQNILSLAEECKSMVKGFSKEEINEMYKE